jgi:hypothetical protein
MMTSPLSPYFSCRACRSLYWGVRPVHQPLAPLMTKEGGFIVEAEESCNSRRGAQTHHTWKRR